MALTKATKTAIGTITAIPMTAGAVSSRPRPATRARPSSRGPRRSSTGTEFPAMQGANRQMSHLRHKEMSHLRHKAVADTCVLHNYRDSPGWEGDWDGDARDAAQASSFSRRRSLTTFGFAFPPVSFITCPTKKPSSPSFPPR